MKRTIKNKKVIKAITIGLAAMITATSTPIEVLAEDENINLENNENQSNENNETQESSVSEVASECAEIISESNNQIESTSEAISDASDAVDALSNAPADVVLTIQNELQEGATDIANAGGDLQIAVQAFNDALVADLNTDKAVNLEDPNSAISNVAKAEENLNDFNNANKSTTKNSNTVINQTNIANTSNDKEEAYAAKDKAVEELSNAEKGLEAAEKVYDLASDAVTEAQNKYDAAVLEQKKAVEKLNEAKAKLKDANTNATAANEMLKAAQAKMDQLDSEVAKLAQSKEDLEAIQNQYYKFMVHFYRDNKINTAVYNEDGSLNIAESAKKANEKGKTEDTSATENTYKLGRELMKDLIIYKLKANGAENIQFAVEEKGLSKKQSADGTLTEDNKGNDKVNIEGTQDQYWDYSSGNSGRLHNVKVTYTIKNADGTTDTITEHYNYILKANQYGDTLDLENGPLYLAKIDPKAKTVTRDQDINNMDNFTNLSKELNKAIEAIKVIDKYDAAKKAVDNAQSLVDNLNKAIKTLSEKEIKFNENKLDELKEELDNAKELLKLATEEKEALEDKVEEARKAVDAIDLSRFDISDVAPVEDDTDDDTPSDAGDPISTPTDFIIPSESIIPTFEGDATVLPTVTTDVSAGTGSGTPAADVAGARVNPTNPISANNNQKLVKIGDNEIPLSNLPNIVDENSLVNSLLYWLGFSLLLVLILLIIYEINKKIKEEKEKNKEEQ